MDWILYMVYELALHNKEMFAPPENTTIIETIYEPKMEARLRREVEEYHDSFSEPFHNSFVAMHMQAAKKLNPSKCWVCTHSPVSHQTIPLLGISSTLKEIEEEAHFEKARAVLDDKSVSLLLYTSVPIKSPSICINFTQVYTPEQVAQGYRSSTMDIGNSDCMTIAQVRHWFDTVNDMRLWRADKPD